MNYKTILEASSTIYYPPNVSSSDIRAIDRYDTSRYEYPLAFREYVIKLCNDALKPKRRFTINFMPKSRHIWGALRNLPEPNEAIQTLRDYLQLDLWTEDDFAYLADVAKIQDAIFYVGTTRNTPRDEAYCIIEKAGEYAIRIYKKPPKLFIIDVVFDYSVSIEKKGILSGHNFIMHTQNIKEIPTKIVPAVLRRLNRIKTKIVSKLTPDIVKKTSLQKLSRLFD